MKKARTERPEGLIGCAVSCCRMRSPDEFEADPVADVPSHDVTRFLARWKDGDEAALQQLLSIVPEELRRLARRQMAGERPGRTLQPTALANEAYLRLVDLKQMQWQDRDHFFAMARLMRRILVDFARSRGYQKRGGGAQQVSFTQALKVAEGQPTDVVALDDALEELAQVDERKSRVVLPARRSCSSGEPTSAWAGSSVRSCSTRTMPEAHYQLAQAYRRLGRTEDAERALKAFQAASARVPRERR